MAIKNRREAIAQFLGIDYAEMQDYRYHYGHTTKPVWALEGAYYAVTKKGEKPAKHRNDHMSEDSNWDWVEVPNEFINQFGWIIWKHTN